MQHLAVLDSSLRCENSSFQSPLKDSEKSCCKRNQSTAGRSAPKMKCYKVFHHDVCSRLGSGSQISNEEGNLAETFMQEVPDEILDLILVFAVRGHKDMRSLALTCKRWRVFAEQDVAWKRLSIRGWGNRSDIIQIPIEKEPSLSWYEYYKIRILSHLPEVCYMKTQQHLTVSIRSILINWLLAVIDEFQHGDEVTSLPYAHHQTVALFDSYCASLTGAIQTNELQMIGAACAVMALNFEDDVDSIDSSFFEKASFYTDGACTAEEIVEVSRKIFDTLDLVGVPLPETACQQIDELLTAMQKNYVGSSTYCLSHYLGELALQAETSLKFSPMCIGTAAYALACHTLGWAEGIWMPIVRNKSPFSSLSQLQPCMAELQGLLRQALAMLTRRTKKGNLPHVIVKYSRRERQHVAKVIITPTAWPAVCPHGQSREPVHEYCEACCAEAAAAGATDFDGDLFPAEDTMDAGGHGGFDHTAAASAGAGGAEADDSDAECDDELSQGDGGGAAQTPGSDALAAHPHPHRAQSRPDTSSPAAPAASDSPPSSAPSAVVRVGEHALQDVSFGAMSESNDNSFVAYGDLILDDEGLLAAPDRRASLTSVLHAVDEEASPVPVPGHM